MSVCVCVCDLNYAMMVTQSLSHVLLVALLDAGDARIRSGVRRVQGDVVGLHHPAATSS